MNTTPPWTLAIDFGTSYTVAAVRVDGSAPEVIDVAGERRVPSVVLADDDGLVVGRAAEELANAHPELALRAPKSHLGELAPVVLGGRPYLVVDLVGALLAHVAEEATRHCGSAPGQVRLTHPATWSGVRRNQLLRAAEVAGLPNPTLVPEPIAAAVSYAQHANIDRGRHVVVYDLGGGTFDTAILRSTGSGFDVVGRPSGDSQLGGELFDELLANHLGAQLDPGIWEELQLSNAPGWQRSAASLRSEARRVKEALSAHPYAELLVALPGGQLQMRVTRDELDALIRPHLEDSVELLRSCMADASVAPADIHAIFLAGGGSRSPVVEQVLRGAFPTVPLSRLGDPKLAVALGATLDAATPPGSVALPPATSRQAIATSTASVTQVHLSEPTGLDRAPTTISATRVSPQPLPPPLPASTVHTVREPSPVSAPLPPAAAPPPRRRGRVLASVGGAVVLLAAALGAVSLRVAGAGNAQSSPPTVSVPAVPATPATRPPTTTTTTTSTTTAPTTSTTTTATTEAPPSSEDSGPTQAQLDAATLSAADFGDPAWVTDTPTDFPQVCNQEPAVQPELTSGSYFKRDEPFALGGSTVQSYANEDEAIAALDDYRAVVEGCPSFTVTLDGGAEVAIGVTEVKTDSHYCDDSVTTLYATPQDEQDATFTGVRTLIRCGRNVVTLDLFSGASMLSDADINLFITLEAAASGRLQSIPL